MKQGDWYEDLDIATMSVLHPCSQCGRPDSARSASTRCRECVDSELLNVGRNSRAALVRAEDARARQRRIAESRAAKLAPRWKRSQW